MTDSIDEIKKDLIQLIGVYIDESCLLNISDSFVEMDEGVIHCCAGKDHYFKVTLTETTKDEYWKTYEP